MISSLVNALIASVAAVTVSLSGCGLIPPAYDYSRPVPESAQREDAWLDGSAVIGHSLMEGFEMFSKVDADIHYFTDTGISAKAALSFGGFDLPGGGTGTLADGLGRKGSSRSISCWGSTRSPPPRTGSKRIWPPWFSSSGTASPRASPSMF